MVETEKDDTQDAALLGLRQTQTRILERLDKAMARQIRLMRLFTVQTIIIGIGSVLMVASLVIMVWMLQVHQAERDLLKEQTEFLDQKMLYQHPPGPTAPPDDE